jgi:DEAD/DEAH box helicase domain-containing protein
LDEYCWSLVFLTRNRYHTHPQFMPYPAKHVSIRGVEEERYTVVDVSRIGQPGGEPKVLEEVEVSRALFEVCTVDSYS